MNSYTDYPSSRTAECQAPSIIQKLSQAHQLCISAAKASSFTPERATDMMITGGLRNLAKQNNIANIRNAKLIT